jgi:folate-binding protein YgfZ
MHDFEPQYAALTRAAGLVELKGRTLIEITGGDRAAFLHNFCTNDIKKLTPGAGCEIFLTDVRGKTYGYGYVFCEDASLVLETVPGQAETIISNLDRYLIREDAQLHDRTGEWSELLLAGPQAEDVLRQSGVENLPAERLAHVAARIGDAPARLRRVDWTGPNGFLIQTSAADIDAVRDALLAAGGVLCGEAAFDAARIEAGTPLFGRDVTAANLPQEIDRDRRAISFTKGCYLGQETVARIDALGHVNKMLRGLRFAANSTVPEPGTELTANDKPAATVTSAAYSPKHGAPFALAYVRRGFDAPGTKLQSPHGEAEVVGLR